MTIDNTTVVSSITLDISDLSVCPIITAKQTDKGPVVTISFYGVSGSVTYQYIQDIDHNSVYEYAD